jgi:hypothetical protein
LREKRDGFHHGWFCFGEAGIIAANLGHAVLNVADHIRDGERTCATRAEDEDENENALRAHGPDRVN